MCRIWVQQSKPIFVVLLCTIFVLCLTSLGTCSVHYCFGLLCWTHILHTIVCLSLLGPYSAYYYSCYCLRPQFCTLQFCTYTRKLAWNLMGCCRARTMTFDMLFCKVIHVDQTQFLLSVWLCCVHRSLIVKVVESKIESRTLPLRSGGVFMPWIDLVHGVFMPWIEGTQF